MSISGGTVTGGDGEGSRIIYNDNGSLPIPIRSGNYQFDGWFKAKAGGTKVTVDTVLTKDSTIYAHWTNTDGSGSMGGSGGSTGGPAAAVGGLKESLPKNHTGETEIINNVKVPSYVEEVIWKAMEDGRWRLGWVVIDGKYYYFHEKPNVTRGRMHPDTMWTNMECGRQPQTFQNCYRRVPNYWIDVEYFDPQNGQTKRRA